jgi:CHAT domain-containing protein/tetratricopeptide (TPR) repeat protein
MKRASVVRRAMKGSPPIGSPMSRSHRSLRTPAVRLLSLALLAGCAAAVPPTVPPAPPSAASGTAVLAVGRPVERAIAPGERQIYELDLAAGQLLEVRISSRDSAPAVALTGPDGAVLAEAGPTFSEGVQAMWAITGSAGVHRLTVAAPAAGAAPAAPPGHYELALSELRGAVAGDAARVAAEQALAQALRLRAPRTPEALGSAYTALEGALRLAREPGAPAVEAAVLNALGETCYYQARWPEAQAWFEQALAAARAGGSAWVEAHALNNLGVVFTVLGRTREAEGRYREALARWEALGDDAQRSETLYSFGFLLLDTLGDLDGAAQAFGQALAIGQRLGAPAVEAKNLNGLGLVARRQGEIDEAFTHFRRALELARRAGDGLLEVTLLRHLGSLHRRRGELQEALRIYLEILAAGQGTVGTRSRVVHDLATVYVDLGDLEKARASYQQVLDLAPPERYRYSIDALVNLGLVLHRQGDHEGALTRWQRALELSRTGGYTSGEALTRQNLGTFWREQGDPTAGLGELARARELWSALGEKPQEAKALHEIGTAYRALGRTAEAAAAFDRALELAQGDPALTALCLSKRAELDRDEGRLEQARAGYEEALRAVESVRRAIGSDALRTSFLAVKRPYYEAYLDVLVRLDRLHPGQGYAEAALAASERARARGLLDLLAEGRVEVHRGLDPDLQRRESELQAELVRAEERLAAARALAPPDPSSIALLERRRIAVEQDLEALAGEIRRRNPRYAQVRYPAPLAAAAVQAQLGPDTLLLEYAVGAEVSYLFAVTRESLTVTALPPAADLVERVRALRRALQAPDRRQLGRYVEEAGGLYRLLVAPAGDLLRRKPRLLIAPDGPLHLFPFEALLTDVRKSRGRPLRDLPFLLREHAVGYIPSASVLAEVRAPRAAAPGAGMRLIAFADPWYGPEAQQTAAVRAGGGEGATFAALPESRREVARIAGLYPPGAVELYLDHAASEENVKANPRLAAARTLHFAAHGVIDEQRPLLSGLALARPAGGPDDGMLRAYEVFDLRLDADLVVLSACETGLGQQVSGEGIVGLSRAFFYAGAASVLVSLWNVAEASTPDLMVSFYRQLGASDQREALRRAKLETIAAGTYAHPFYWSPFVLVGDTGPEL